MNPFVVALKEKVLSLHKIHSIAYLRLDCWRQKNKEVKKA